MVLLKIIFFFFFLLMGIGIVFLLLLFVLGAGLRFKIMRMLGSASQNNHREEEDLTTGVDLQSCPHCGTYTAARAGKCGNCGHKL